MSYKLKNTLILIANNVILGALGIYFTLSYYPKMVAELSDKSSEFSVIIAGVPERKNYLNELIELAATNDEPVIVEEKPILKDVSLAEVLSFVDEIHKKVGHFSFSLSELNQTNRGLGNQITFALNGDGKFNSIYWLIQSLEHGRLNLNIGDLQMQSIEKSSEKNGINSVDISFEMRIIAHPYFSNSETVERTAGHMVSNLFSPVISSRIKPNIQHLVESERSELRAILPDKAIIKDHRGKLVTLQEGDKVYLGFLTKIDRDRNRLIFTLNKGGIVKDQILSMSFSN